MKKEMWMWWGCCTCAALGATEVVVTAPRLSEPTKQAAETVYTGTEITWEGLALQGNAANASVYEAVQSLSGVSVESADASGLAAEQRYIRVRGVRGYLGALTVAGVPNNGGNPMGPREYLYDKENLSGIAVYKGVVPADLGTGVGARGGAMELRPLWPEEASGLKASFGTGANSYSRLFARVDSGALPATGSRLSLSGSYAEADKWKGAGKSGPRRNMNLLFSQPVSEDESINLWFNFNDLEQHLYRSLSYDQARNIKENYSFDFNQELTGVAGQDIYYYDFNKGSYRNVDFLAEVPLFFADRFSLKLKPYYSKEDALIWGGTSSQGGTLQQRTRDLERYGLIGEAVSEWKWGSVSAGYWMESVGMDISTRNYHPVTGAFRGYGMLTKDEDDGLVQSPWLKLAGTTGKLDWQAGLKYFHYTDPASQGFVSSPTNTNELIEAPDLYREQKSYGEPLPSVGLCYHCTDEVEVYAGYGRNQIRPYAYMPLINLYNQNRATFQAAGITLNDLFEGYDMEISDNVEVGVRYLGEWLELRPAIFYSKHDTLLVTVYDPRVNLSYYQYTGSATGAGFELEANIFVTDHLTLFANPSYTSLTYDQDLTYQGTTMQTEGNQLVDTPEFMVKAGAILNWGEFRLVPSIRYTGKRYGDAENTEAIDGYVVADLKADYTFNQLDGAEGLKVSLDLSNLCDERYVSGINASDDSRAGKVGYYAGAPFTAMLSFSLEI